MVVFEPEASRVDVQMIRDQFPALAGSTVFLENAGGSQVPRVVADAIHRYMLETYVQLEAGYELSEYCTHLVDEAHDFVNLFMNGRGIGRVALGPSTSVLCRMLADCHADVLEPGDEILIAQSGHEANISPWVRLEQRGMTVRFWPVDRGAMRCPIETLDSLLTDRTKIVAIDHVSNLLGHINDVQAITKLAHDAGARVVVDGVAYAPHRAIDVAAWEVDWYVYSTYKVYGPHMAAMFGRDDAWASLTGPNHFFIPRDEVPYKFELGGASHEGCAGLLGLGEYLCMLADRESGAVVDRDVVKDAFEIMARCELPAQERLIQYLLQKPGVRVIGPQVFDRSRVGTVSFRREGVSAASICRAASDRNIGIRHGHMYAYRLCEGLGLDLEAGVVRVSLVHYNSVEEIDRLIAVLDTVL